MPKPLSQPLEKPILRSFRVLATSCAHLSITACISHNFPNPYISTPLYSKSFTEFSGFNRFSGIHYTSPNMPIPIIIHGLYKGIDEIPYFWTVLKVGATGLVIGGLKKWFGGAVNGSERNMHGKVVIVTVSPFFPSLPIPIDPPPFPPLAPPYPNNLHTYVLTLSTFLGRYLRHRRPSRKRPSNKGSADSTADAASPLRPLPRRLYLRSAYSMQQRTHYSRNRGSR